MLVLSKKKNKSETNTDKKYYRLALKHPSSAQLKYMWVSAIRLLKKKSNFMKEA